jgi:ankyrin repeat protein
LSQEFTSLHVAAQKNHMAVVKRLVEKGADIEAKSEVAANRRCAHFAAPVLQAAHGP